jgi:two-component system phosphate regulon response regulator PhoB
MLPIIMLSARGEELMRLRGFCAGADDFVIKPFSMRELIARVRALLRRSRFAVEGHLLTRGDLQLDHETGRVRRGLRDVHLRPTEFRLLECLLERPGSVFSRQHLLELAWGPSVDITDRAVDVHIGRLRKALSTGRERDPILSVRGAGYSFDETFGKPSTSKFADRLRSTREPDRGGLNPMPHPRQVTRPAELRDQVAVGAA